jgi:hypothetical protein
VKIRIGVAESEKIIEVEVDDAADFEATMSAAFDKGTGLIWLTDTRRRRVGIPRERVAYVEIDTMSDRPAVGFGG